MDAIIIGGGPAGLVAANELADRGVGVTLLERRSRLGGRAAADVQDGFVLNQGPHALYLGGPAERTLRRYGLPLIGHAPRLRGPLVVRDGVPRPLLRALPPRDTAAFTAWMARLRQRAGGPARSSAADWLAAEIDRPGARALAMAITRVATYTGDLDRLSADAARAQLRRAFRSGVRYLDGGWQTIVDALADRARSVVFSQARVDAIDRAGGGWVVSTDAGELRADAVVVAAGSPERARRLLEGAADTSAWRTGPEATAATLDLALEALPEPRHTFATSVDGPLYFSVHSPPARLAPHGVLASVARYGACPGARGQLEAHAELAQPGWAGRALFTRHLPGMTVISAIPVPEHGGLAGRPDVALPDAPGLFVAGDWVGDEGMLLDAAVASALRAAHAAAAVAPAKVAA